MFRVLVGGAGTVVATGPKKGFHTPRGDAPQLPQLRHPVALRTRASTAKRQSFVRSIFKPHHSKKRLIELTNIFTCSSIRPPNEFAETLACLPPNAMLVSAKSAGSLNRIELAPRRLRPANGNLRLPPKHPSYLVLRSNLKLPYSQNTTIRR